MMGLKINEDNELTIFTMDIIRRSEIIKEKLSNSMTLGSDNIVLGINIFEDMVKKVNYEYIDNDGMLELENMINYYLVNEEYRNQRIDNNVHIGINMCFMMLNCYINLNNYSSKKKVLVNY